MKYHCGTKIKLGDKVSIPSPDGSREMIVVMIGDSMEHLDIDDEFVDWVKRDNLLNGKDIVLEFIGENTLKHNNPEFAPVGDYMFSPVDQFLKFQSREEHDF